MRLRTIAIAATVIAVALVVTVVAILSSMDFNQYRGLIAERVKEATGRDLTIKGDLKLALGLSPAVAVNDVTFANAPWGSRPTMAEIRRFEAEVALLPLIFGDINVKRVVLIDADILLETDKKGRGNWEFVETAAQDAAKPQPPDKAGEAPTKLPAVNAVDVRNARLTYRDGQTGETATLGLQRATLAADSPTDPLELDIEGAFNELAFSVGGTVGSIQAMSRPGTPFPVSINGDIADAAQFKVDGTIREPLAAKGYELTIAAQGGEIARLARIGGVQIAPVGPFSVNAKITDGAPGGNPSIPQLKVELGKPELVVVRAEGSLRDPLAQRGIDLSAIVEGQEIGAFSGFGVPGLAAPLPPVPALGPFRAAVKIANGPGDRPTIPQLKVEVGRPDLLKASIEGAIQDPLAAKGFNLNIAAEAQELKAVAEKAGVQAPISGPLTLTARLADAGAQRYALTGLDLKAGNSDLRGEATLATGGARPAITANLTSAQLDLAAFMGPQDQRAGQASPGAAGGGGGGGKSNRVFSDEPLPFDVLNASDGDVRYRAEKVLAKGTTVGNLAMSAAWRNGEFNLKPLTAELGGGKLTVEASINARNQTVATKVDARGIDLGALLKQLEITDLLRNGRTDFALDVRGAGRSLHAVMAGLQGSTTLHVQEGSIERRFIDLLGADVVRVLSPLQDSGPQTQLVCVVDRFDIKDGVATPKVLFLETGKMIVAGEGSVNLGTEQLDLMLAPRPKEASLASLAIPIRVGGTLAEPSFSPDAAAAAKGVAGAVAGAVLLGPVGVLAPFVSGGAGEGDRCAQALSQAGVKASTTAPAQGQPQSQQPQRQAPSSPVQDLERGLQRLLGR